MLFLLIISRLYIYFIKAKFITFREIIDTIMHLLETITISCPSSIMPNNLISKLIFTKYLVHKNFHIVSNMPIQMHIDRSSVAHNGFDCNKVLIHPIQIAFFVPYIAIHLFFEVAQLFTINFSLGLFNSLCHFWIATNINLLGIIGTTCKRWVNINKVYFHSFFFKISTSRKTFAT